MTTKRRGCPFSGLLAGLLASLMLMAACSTLKTEDRSVSAIEAISFSGVVHRALQSDIAAVGDLPDIGKWMIAPDGGFARWLGGVYYGKELREPINVILIDSGARNPEEAKGRVVAACAEAGYDVRMGHSSGYWGYIDGQLFGQLPDGDNRAFSDAPFETANNHGRIFGPYYDGTQYVFIGAFSREKVNILAKVKHEYVSFNQARDHFAAMMDRKTAYKLRSFTPLGNEILASPSVTTADHDGVAAVLSAR